MSEADSKPPTSPPLPHHPKLRSAVSSQSSSSDSPPSKPPHRSSSTVVRPQEGDKLASSIRATYHRKSLVEIDPITVNGYDRSSYEDGVGEQEDSIVNLKSESLEAKDAGLRSVQEPPRDKGDAIRTQAATAPLITMPPIDFDGLSWPCMHSFDL